MESSDLTRYQIIKRLVARHSDQGADAVTDLWRQLTDQVIFIVGEIGFESLYARSVFTTQSTYPWLSESSVAPQPDGRFGGLKMTLERQTPTEAREANVLLLKNLTGILASMIGEQLTANILRSAWGDDATDPFDKDFNNE
jgi:hypothetical protein